MPAKDQAAYMRKWRAGKRIGITRGSRKPDNSPVNRGQPAKHSPEVLRAILDALLKPYTGLEMVAKAYGISVQAIHLWQKLSAQHEKEGKTDSPFLISYLDQDPAFFHRWVAFVRAVAVNRIDARIIEAATSAHFEPLFNAQTGTPFWEVDPKVAADAKSLCDFDWGLAYDDRDRADIYKRDENGALIQVTKEVAPSPAILVKAAASLLSQVYGERVAHTVMVGGVVRIGPNMAPAPKQLAPAPTHQVLDADFTPVDEEHTEPTNVLAVAEPPETVAQFEEVFGGKRLVEAILFFAEDGALLPPLADIVIVEGSSIHRTYVEAGIEVDAVPAAPLIAQGYCNDFLLPLATADEVARVKTPEKYVPMPEPEPEPELRRHPRAYNAATGEKFERPTPGGGERYATVDGEERTGYGVPPPGGVSVTKFPRRSIIH
ncbi:MAG: hypothetical protein ACLPTZ_28770 [Beijerinckiaceae bacterium]